MRHAANQRSDNMSWHFNKKAISMAVSLSRSKRPDSEKWPAPMLVLSSNILESVFSARSLATHFAGSQKATRGSQRPAVTRILGYLCHRQSAGECSSKVMHTGCINRAKTAGLQVSDKMEACNVI